MNATYFRLVWHRDDRAGPRPRGRPTRRTCTSRPATNASDACSIASGRRIARPGRWHHEQRCSRSSRAFTRSNDVRGEARSPAVADHIRPRATYFSEQHRSPYVARNIWRRNAVPDRARSAPPRTIGFAQSLCALPSAAQSSLPSRRRLAGHCVGDDPLVRRAFPVAACTAHTMVRGTAGMRSNAVARCPGTSSPDSHGDDTPIGHSLVRAIHLGQVAPCFLGFASTGGRRRVWVRRGRVVMVGRGVGRSREGWRSGCCR